MRAGALRYLSFPLLHITILSLLFITAIVLYIYQTPPQSQVNNHIIQEHSGIIHTYRYFPCLPGVFGTLTQLKWDSWAVNRDVNIPMYTTHDIDAYHPEIEYVIILQHGNLRNANNYYCAALESLSSSSESEKYLIIAPQFLIEGDACWDVNGSMGTVTVNYSCGFMVYTSEGWKDGSYNTNESNLKGSKMYSYDVLNALVNHVGNRQLFPNVQKITLFGFSAGAQMLQRYALMSSFNIESTSTSVNFIISDPSTYVYFNEQRVFARSQIGMYHHS